MYSKLLTQIVIYKYIIYIYMYENIIEIDIPFWIST